LGGAICPNVVSRVVVGLTSLGFHQTPEVNYLDSSKTREIPCREKAEPLICRENGYSETVQIIHFVRLVCMFLPRLTDQDNL